MDDVRTGYAGRVGTREAVSTATLLGQVMFLVAVGSRSPWPARTSAAS